MSATSRREALRVLAEGRLALSALFEALPDDEMLRPATIGGGDWSAKDLMGHIAFWEELASEALAEWRAGRRPSIEDVTGRQAVDEMNAREYEATTLRSLADVRERAGASHAAISEAIGEISDEEWEARSFYGRKAPLTLGELLGRVLGAPKGPFAHASAHIPDLEAYVATVRGVT